MPIDDDIEDEHEDEAESAASALQNVSLSENGKSQSIVEESKAKGWRPKKSKFVKKKGGHLDKRKK